MNVINVLLVEDNEGDILLTLEAFKELKASTKIKVVRDGAAAIAYLKKQGEYQDSPVPNIILLDINMPGINGIEVLDYIKQDPGLRTIPVVMLTTSAAETDIKTCYEKSANSFITKPIDFGKFVEVVESIEKFWFQAAQLPGTAA